MSPSDDLVFDTSSESEAESEAEAGQLPFHYPITSSIEDLLKDVDEGIHHIKRNSMTIYSLVAAFKEILEKIHNLIKEADKEETGSYLYFEKYIIAINPLEDVLIMLLTHIDDEADLLLPPQIHDLTEFLEYLTVWQKRRGVLRGLPATFRTQLHNAYSGLLHNVPDATKQSDPVPEFMSVINQSREGEEKHDDAKLLHALCCHIKEYNIPGSRPPRLNEVQSKAGNAQERISASKSVVEDEIRVVVLVYWVVTVSTDNNASAALQEQLITKGSELWDETSKALDNLIKHLAGTIADGPFKDAVDAFESYLRRLAGAVDFPRGFAEFRKSSKDVAWPFHSQTLVLINQCLKLAQHFSSHKNANNFMHFNNAIVSAKKAVDAAATATSSPPATFDPDDVNANGVRQAFQSAEAPLRSCVTEYQKSGLQCTWEQYTAKMASAVQNDKKRVEQMNARIKARNNRPTVTTNTIKVSVHGSGAPLDYDVLETARLSEILWKHHRALPTGTTSLPLHFYIQKGARREPIALDKLVTDVPVNTANQRVVYMSDAVAPPAPTPQSARIPDRDGGEAALRERQKGATPVNLPQGDRGMYGGRSPVSPPRRYR